MNFTPEEKEVALRVLEEMCAAPATLYEDERLAAVIARLHKSAIKSRRREARAALQEVERSLLHTTGIVSSVLKIEPQALPLPALAGPTDGPNYTQGEAPDLTPPEAIPASVTLLPRPRPCYVCKTLFTELHFFYHQMCPECAAFNYAKRTQSADLRGRVALLTGGRIKIGYQTAIRLLTDGAKVYLTTRFPQDAVRRFMAEPGYAEWGERLKIIGLDLRRIPDVERLADWLYHQEPEGLDIIIHNAAQTVKRPLDFYRHLLDAEARPSGGNNLVLQLTGSEQAQQLGTGVEISQEEIDHVRGPGGHLLEMHPHYSGHIETEEGEFPLGIIDGDGQQLDARAVHSWTIKMEEVSTVELVEVQVVNSIAPFILNSRLKPLMCRSRFARRFIINVSAMEGQFSRSAKTPYHPHTNMAKAALNMMTRTSAADYAKDGIYMNAVDTGWITDENPLPKKQRLQQENGFFAPLDSQDGMARIYDPIACGVNEPQEPFRGHFLKDYKPYPW